LAIVGLGWAGTRQAEAAAELGREVEVVALVDNDPDFLAERATALGVARTYPDLEAALADPDVEAVSICTPHTLHADQAIAAAGAGRHVLVEKPMAMTVADAARMAAAAEAAGVCLYVAESEVYLPYSLHLRTLVQAGEVGELTFASHVSGYRAPSPSYPGRRAWLTLPELGGTGSWYLQGVHAIASVRYVLGEIATVFVRDHHTSSWERPDLEATMSALFVLESGLGVWFVQSTETQVPPALRGFQLYGERGVIIGGRDGYDLHRTGLAREGSDAERPVEHHPYPDPGLSSYALELDAFARTARGEVVGPTTGRAEMWTLAVLEAGAESARTGLPVSLRERFPELSPVRVA
jgi:predicted dehydrogenase